MGFSMKKKKGKSKLNFFSRLINEKDDDDEDKDDNADKCGSALEKKWYLVKRAILLRK